MHLNRNGESTRTIILTDKRRIVIILAERLRLPPGTISHWIRSENRGGVAIERVPYLESTQTDTVHNLYLRTLTRIYTPPAQARTALNLLSRRTH
jgi:hypothetical protein